MVTTLKASPLAVQGLRDRISQLPADRQLVLRDTWPDDLPSLLDPDLTVDDMDRVRQLVTNVENPPPQPPAGEIPAERVAELRTAVNALPEDLVLQLSAAAAASGVPPQMKGATAEHEQVVTRLLEAMTAEQTARRGRVHGRMAAFDNDDTIRHALIQFATGGRVASSSQVTAEEVDLVGKAADMLELGDLLLVVDEAGTRVADPDGKWSLPSPEVDWKQVAKDHDTTQAALLRRARQQAIEAGEEAPSKLQQLSPQQTARLLAPAPPETTTAAAEPQEDLAPATPAAPAEPEQAPDAAQGAAGSVLVVLVRPGGLQQHMVDDTTATEILRLVGAA